MRRETGAFYCYFAKNGQTKVPLQLNLDSLSIHDAVTLKQSHISAATFNLFLYLLFKYASMEKACSHAYDIKLQQKLYSHLM